MKTKYITTLTARISPFQAHSKVPRLVLSLLPPTAHRSIQIKTTQLPRTSTESSLLELGFKDGKTMKWEWTGKGKEEGEVGLMDITQEIARHTRQLGRKEELNG